jgi:hypothetical protein
MVRENWEKKMGEGKEKSGDVLIGMKKKKKKKKKERKRERTIFIVFYSFLVKLVKLLGVVFVCFYQIVSPGEATRNTLSLGNKKLSKGKEIMKGKIYFTP